MKFKLTKTILLTLTLVLVILANSGCSNPAKEEEAFIVLSIGNDSLSGKAVSIDQLVHTITFSGPSSNQTRTISGAGSVKVTVAPGLWFIDVDAFLGGVLYAKGSATAEVKAGLTTSVTVYMNVILTESGGGGGGGSNPGSNTPTPLTGSVSIDGDLWVNATLTANTSSLVGSGTPGYKWTSGSNIIGTNATYMVQEADIGQTIMVEVTMSDNTGEESASVTISNIIGIYTLAQLIAIKDSTATMAGDYVLGDDLTISGGPGTYEPIGTQMDCFAGSFDGNGKTITLSPGAVGYSVWDNFTDHNLCIGVFGGVSGTVKNLKLEGSITVNYPGPETGVASAGALTGYNGGTIENIASSVSIYVNYPGSNVYAGGIVGDNDLGEIKNCYNTGAVTGQGGFAYTWVGGITGSLHGNVITSSVEHCWASGDVTLLGTTLTLSSGGGIVGYNYNADGHITNCVAFQDLISSNPSSGNVNVGRILGTFDTTNVSGNYANDAMLLSTNGGSTQLPATTSATNGTDADLSTDIGSQAWWESTIWSGVWGGAAADENYPWVWRNGHPELWFIP